MQKRFTDLRSDIAESVRRGPKALGALAHGEIARLMPVLQAAEKK